MTRLFKIFLVIAAVQWFNASADPLFQGVSFQRGFELNFKPWPRKGIAFIKEHWSPLGIFGKKFAITKRSLDDIMSTIEDKPAPVFEHLDEIQHTGPLFIIPKAPVAYAVPSPKPPPLVPPVVTKETPPLPKPVALPIIVNDLPPLPFNLDMAPPISTNMVIIQPTKVMNSHVIPPPTRLYTDISRVESIKDHMHVVKPGPEPLKPVVPIAPISPPPPVPAAPVAPVPPPPPIVTVSSPPPVMPVPPPPPVEPVISSTPVVHVTPLPPPAVPPAPVITVPPPPPPKEPIVAVVPQSPVPIKEEIKEEIKEIQTEIKEEKTGLFSKDNSLVKGSKMALQFGTVFLTLMAQFFDSARASIDLFTNPPPKFVK